MAPTNRERERLVECLRDGLNARPDVDPRALLGASEQESDRGVARRLVEAAAQADIARLGAAEPARRSLARESVPLLPVEASDASFLGRLKTQGDQPGEQSLAHMADVPTLLSVLRAGSLLQRRAAAKRIAERLADQELSAIDQASIETLLEQLRDVEIAYELAQCRSLLPEGRSREAQKAQRAQAEMVASIEREVRGYWDEQGEEPFMKLSGDMRAQLLLHARDLSDLVMAHVATLMEGGASAHDRSVQRAVLSAARYANDSRLVPSLISLLEEGNPSLVVEAARAISRVDDARVWPALVAAYERSVVDTERMALGAALGRVGDVRAADYVREQLRNQDEHVLIRAIEAMRTLGTPEDAPQVAAFLSHGDPVISTKAAHTLGRISDGRSLVELSRLSRETHVGALRAAAEEAIDQIRARLVLRGEEPPEDSALSASEEGRHETATPSPTVRVRLRALRYHILGMLWSVLGLRERALLRFEDAAACRPDWAAPTLAGGMLHAGAREYAQALSLFRRALDAERRSVERNPILIRQVAYCFLRRSEQVEHDGRLAIARGLLDEVLSLDLRRAPSSLRFEIGRRHETLRLLGAG
jgi:tetratricopeptide (TPR) repeat protein